MREHEEILLGGMFRPTEQNCPTREGELIESLDKIHDIPNPRVGMRVYVENTGKEYIVKSLKEKTIGGVNVPGAAVDEFEEAVTFSPTDKEKLYKSISRNLAEFQADDTNVEFVCWDDENKKHFVAHIEGATEEFAGVMTAEDKRNLDGVSSLFMLEDNANKFMYVGKFTNLNDAFTRCATIGRENPTLSMLKFDVVSGNIYDSLFIMQTYNRNESIVTQFYMYGEGHKHSCKVRHIVTNGTVDEWQEIQLYTSYSFEDGVLYGYKYGKSESEQNKVAIVDIPNIGAGEYFVPTSGKYNIDGNTYRTIRFGLLPPPGVIINLNITNPEVVTLYVPTAPYALTVSVNGNVIEGLSGITSAGVYYIFANTTGVKISKILPIQ